jgi:signal transduction histidine kinase
VSAAVAEPLRRDPANGVVAGVCAGLARRMRLDPVLLRAVAVAATLAGGTGLGVYLLAWAVMPADGDARAPIERLAGRSESRRVAAGIGLLALAGLLLLREWGLWLGDVLVWPVVLAAAGAAMIWRQSTVPPPPAREPAPAPAAAPPGAAPSAAAPSAAAPSAAAPPGAAPAGAPPAAAAAAAARSALRVPRDAAGRNWVGIALVVGGALVFLGQTGALGAIRDVLLSVLVVLVALTLILAPWWLRLVRGLAAERSERIRSQERAEVAAHLHDSVLQTLALMQKRANDPREVATLARRQERELRTWLNEGRRARGADATLAAALEAAAAEVEERHGIAIDVVAVGDAPLDERAQAVVDAAREALVNAAKFAPDAPVSLYAEVGDARIEVFVRDRGPGFDPAAVPPDRRGVRESIVGRMERHGGRARVQAAAGAGTEVELVMELVR